MEKDGIYYLDGGIVDPLPVDLVKRTGNDLLVAVDLNAMNKPMKVTISESEQSKLDELANKFLKWRNGDSSSKNDLGVFDMLNEAFDLTQDMLTTMILERNRPHIHVKISRKQCGVMDFHKADQLMAVGKEATKRAIAKYHKQLTETEST